VQFTGPDELVYGIFYSEELRAAIAQGYAVETYGGLQCDRVEGVFDSFVNSLHARRCEHKARGEEGMQKATKLMLNGLYGRLAMRNTFDSVALHPLGSPKLKDTSGWTNTEIVRTTGNKDLAVIQTRYGTPSSSPPPTSLPAAAAITAIARVVLSQYINLPGNRLVYSDTDAVFLERPLTPRQRKAHVSKDNELGKLKDEGTWLKFAPIKPKWYSYQPENRPQPVVKAAGLTIESPAHAALVRQSMLEFVRGHVHSVDMEGPKLTMAWHRGCPVRTRKPINLETPEKADVPKARDLNQIRHSLGSSPDRGLLGMPAEVKACISDPSKLPEHLKA